MLWVEKKYFRTARSAVSFVDNPSFHIGPLTQKKTKAQAETSDCAPGMPLPK